MSARYQLVVRDYERLTGEMEELRSTHASEVEELQTECSNLATEIERLRSFTDEDVERVAEAIWAASEPPFPWADGSELEHENTRDLARAALSAYLERPEWKWTEEELDEMQDLTEAE